MSDFDTLAEAARRRSRTDYAHLDIQNSEYGWAVIVRDAEPFVFTDVYGDEYSTPQGSVITSGFGSNITDAAAAALANLTSPGRPAQPTN